MHARTGDDEYVAVPDQRVVAAEGQGEARNCAGAVGVAVAAVADKAVRGQCPPLCPRGKLRRVGVVDHHHNVVHRRAASVCAAVLDTHTHTQRR
jgi:hypothetical protein